MIGTVDGVIFSFEQDEVTSEFIEDIMFDKVWNSEVSAHYENSDASRTSTLTEESAGGVDIQIRQFDAFLISETDGYSYSRSIFCWPGSGTQTAGVDITEVWEYSDRKEVSVTMYHDENNFSKYLSVTDTSTEFQKTSLLNFQNYGMAIPPEGISGLSYIGYIDFSMLAPNEDEYSLHIDLEDVFLDGYPSFSYIDNTLAKSVSFAEAKALVVDGYSEE